MTQQLKHFIEGALVDATDGAHMTLVDPITERNDTWIMVPPAGDPGPALFDVRSGARGAGDDGTSYATW